MRTDSRRAIGSLVGIAVLATAMFVVPAGAADGDLESVLGGDGSVNVAGLDLVLDIAKAPESRIVAVGRASSQPAVVRLDEDGTIDETFGGGDGTVLVPFPVGATFGSANAVAVSGDGSIAVAGSFGFDGEFVARLDATGELVDTFSGDGVAVRDYEGTGSSRDVVLLADGSVYRLFVCCGAPPYVAVYKYSPTGTESGPFEPASRPAALMSFDANKLVRQGDGKLLLVGTGYNPTLAQSRLVAYRMTAAGARDTTYSTDGWAVPGPGEAVAGALTGGKLLIAGAYEDSGTHSIVARVNADGTLDTTFGGGAGFVHGGAPAGTIGVDEVVVRPDGRFYLVGAPSSGATGVVVQRRTSTGSIDNAFSGDGRALIGLGTEVFGAAGTLGPLGDIIVLGQTLSTSDLVARFDGTTDTAAPTGVAMTKPTARFTLSKTVVGAWTATDPSGVGAYEAQRQAAAYNAPLPGAWSPFYAGAAKTKSMTATTGTTQCFQVRARDVWGAWSGFSTQRCTAVPLTVAQLAFSGGWSKSTAATAYGGTVATTTTFGAKAARSGVVAERVALVVTKCPTCGSVRVTWNGVGVKTVNLAASTTLRKQVVEIAFSGLKTGTLAVTVTSPSGKPVILEGLGVYKD